MTTTRTLLGSLALCISLASASRASSPASHRPSSSRGSVSGSGENWTAALPLRPAAQHRAAHFGHALRQDAPQDEKVLRSGADAFVLKRTDSGKEVKAFAFKHAYEYEGPAEEKRKALRWGAVDVSTPEVDMNAGFRAAEHAHVGAAIVAERQQEKNAELEAYHAKLDQLKVDRDLEQKKLIEKKYKTVETDTRYAPNVDAFKDFAKAGVKAFPRIAELGEYVEGVWEPKALTKAELTEILGDKAKMLVIDQDNNTYEYLHPGSQQKAQMVAFSTDAKKIKANKLYAEAADEFFWRRAPAVFTRAGEGRVIDAKAKADHKKAVMKAAVLKAQEHAEGRVKMLNIDGEVKPWTQKHFYDYTKHNVLDRKEWDLEKEYNTEAANVAEGQRRARLYELRLIKNVLTTNKIPAQARSCRRPSRFTTLEAEQAKLAVLRTELAIVEAEIARLETPAVAADVADE